MGIVKDDMMECEGRGYGHSNKRVCAFCFGDSYLRHYIRYESKKSEYGYCSFCKHSSPRKTMRLEDLMPIVMRFIDQDYLPADGNAIWDGEDKRYLEPTFDPYGFVYDELNYFMECENPRLLGEFVNILRDDERMSVYQINKRQEDIDLEEWNKYCETVKRCPLSAEQIVRLCRKENLDNHKISQPDEIHEIDACLNMVMYYVQKFYMTDILYGISSHYAPTPIYRCINYLGYGQHPYNLSYIPAMSVGAAPTYKTSAGRMNEAGDMMFYGAFDKSVAKDEVGANGNNPATIGVFKPNKRFRLINLSKISSWKCPSAFDVDRREERSIWMFLREFIRIISEPINQDIDYKPTQVLTKYIQRNTDFQGIEYRSSHRRMSYDEKGYSRKDNCVVLFVVNRDCLDGWEKTDSSRSQLVMDKNPVQEKF